MKAEHFEIERDREGGGRGRGARGLVKVERNKTDDKNEVHTLKGEIAKLYPPHILLRKIENSLWKLVYHFFKSYYELCYSLHD